MPLFSPSPCFPHQLIDLDYCDTSPSSHATAQLVTMEEALPLATKFFLHSTLERKLLALF